MLPDTTTSLGCCFVCCHKFRTDGGGEGTQACFEFVPYYGCCDVLGGSALRQLGSSCLKSGKKIHAICARLVSSHFWFLEALAERIPDLDHAEHLRHGTEIRPLAIRSWDVFRQKIAITGDGNLMKLSQHYPELFGVICVTWKKHVNHIYIYIACNIFCCASY